VILVANENIPNAKEDLPMYSSEKGQGRDIIRGIELLNELSGLEYFLNIGYADSFFEYWLLTPGISSKRLTSKMIEPVSDQKIENILVIGAGKGGELVLLNELTKAKIVGIEPSTNNITQAKRLIKDEGKDEEIKVIQGIAEELPFPDGSFSCVYSCEAAFHFDDKRTFIKEAHRVLKNKGSLIIGDITKKPRPSQNDIFQNYKNMLNADEFFTREMYLDIIEDTFNRKPKIEDITDKNIKHLAHGSKLLLCIFEYLDKLPLLKMKIDKCLKKRGIDQSTFLENIKITKLSYEKSMVEYLKIVCVK